jgi:branched-chain amino acid transport system permease protein
MKTLRNNIFVLVTFLILLAVNFLFPQGYHYTIAINVGIAIMLAVSLNLINGITGQFSLGHAGFMCIGAYAAAAFTLFIVQPLIQKFGISGVQGTITLGLFTGVAILIGGLCTMLAGLVVGIPTLRLKGDYLAIATLGFGEIIRIIILNTQSVGGALGLAGMPSLSNFFWVYAWTVLCIVVVARLVYSVKGKAFFAIREDEFAASTIGIDTTRYKVIAFAIGSFFAGAAGGLFAHSSTGFITTSQFDTLKSIEIVVMVVLGGLGSITGAVIAAIVLTVLPEVLRGFSEYRMVVYSALLIVVMLTRPQGLMGMREIYFPKWRSKKKTMIATHV